MISVREWNGNGSTLNIITNEQQGLNVSYGAQRLKVFIYTTLWPDFGVLDCLLCWSSCALVWLFTVPFSEPHTNMYMHASPTSNKNKRKQVQSSFEAILGDF